MNDDKSPDANLILPTADIDISWDACSLQDLVISADASIRAVDWSHMPPTAVVDADWPGDIAIGSLPKMKVADFEQLHEALRLFAFHMNTLETAGSQEPAGIAFTLLETLQRLGVCQVGGERRDIRSGEFSDPLAPPAGTGPTFLGIPIIIDPSLPAGTMRVTAPDGRTAVLPVARLQDATTTAYEEAQEWAGAQPEPVRHNCWSCGRGNTVVCPLIVATVNAQGAGHDARADVVKWRLSLGSTPTEATSDGCPGWEPKP